jgi:hypothetical protein
MKKKERVYYEFTLVLSGISELTPEVEDAVFAAGCDDAMLGMRDGVPFLDFSREAASYQDAVLSAIKDVEKANIGANVVRVEPDDLVTASEIARRLNRSRESVRQLVSGLRGPGNFPQPIAGLKARSPIWRWIDVYQWVAGHEGEVRQQAQAYLDSCLIVAINNLLSVRQLPRPEVTKLYRELVVDYPRHGRRQIVSEGHNIVVRPAATSRRQAQKSSR